MIRAGVGFSNSHNPRVAAAEATASALAQAGLNRALGALCFATPAYAAAYPMILRVVGSDAHTREVAGCSSMGVIAGEHEVESGHALCVMVIGADEHRDELRAARFFVPSLRGRAQGVAAEVATAVRPALGKTNLLILLADTYNFEAEATLAALTSELPKVAITGGGASEDGSIGETFVFCGDVVSSNAVSGMLLSGDFDLTMMSSLACSPIGPAHRVTAARDNILLELDGRGAFDVFAEAAGPLATDLRRALRYVFAAIPLDPRATTIERGRFVVRNIVGASEEHGVVAVSFVPRVGDTIGFVLRDAERSRRDLKASLEEVSGKLISPPAFGLYFDCISRGAGLYGIPGHDSAYLRQSLGQVPIGGFFTGFEIGPLGDQTALLQYSGVLALISNKPVAPS
ncbi:MAG: FIST N-terminal domain-containing protein [Candidatus Binatus sp.]|uniref:FIST N-terminal domain-containing protein n=1 Tax=Candidatus Binatus sp. TaxID=2811406 RepID=UPI00271C99A1|nr:FIST N-terminal domain-containing protein [Candidatus Binatus sp.]MDO8433213.1 FIST N-terminal domain-containing protein [Candidatus Binatus sp.]